MRFLALGFAIGALGCGSALTTPDAGEWVEVRSRHFTVRAEADVASARETATELERFYSAFDQVAYPHEPKPNFAIDVVLFDSERGLKELGHDSGGVMHQRTGPDLEERFTVITHDTLGGSDHGQSERFRHELAHRFTAFHFPSAPIWLNEGFSELFSTMEIDDDTVVLGTYLPDRVFVDEAWGVSGGNDPRLRIPIAEAPSIEVLRHYSKSTFYGLDLSDDPDDIHRIQASYLNYSSAWTLVHLLLLGEGATRRYFLAYLSELARGTITAEEAWLKHLGPPDPRLESRYRSLLKTTDRNVARVPFQPGPPAKLAERALSPAEVHLLWASLRNSSRKEQREAALEDIRSALSLQPHLVSARVGLAMKQIAAGDLVAAEGEMATARRLAPADPTVVQASLVLALEQEDEKAIDRWGVELGKRARTAGAHALLAKYLIRRRKPIAAIRAARAGLAVDPSSWICFVAIAAAHEAMGDLQTTAEYLSMALNMLGEDDGRRTSLMKELEQVEAKARQERTSSSQPSTGPSP